ncbi:hypothetical protein [Leifsonia sp. Leaf264]|uniref:hypothetical protein n=1 Tax=Leifsonia sp. Leaf264 TaxID=1736314 RepID=UPI0006FE033C|nr:hypothetical protein [Leifsonia sp. Leaf264]KQO98894.1 hypothetical protein ASF30_12595 [Leifsonia sp. Leaf264]
MSTSRNPDTTATYQIAVSNNRRKKPRFTSELMGADSTPTDFEDVESDVVIPRLGSLDLLHVAAGAFGEGWSVRRIGVSDGAMLPMEGDVIPDRLRRNLGRHGASSALLWLTDECPGAAVVDVTVIPANGREFTLTRLGGVTGDTSQEAIQLLRSVWSQVR